MNKYLIIANFGVYKIKKIYVKTLLPLFYHI